MYPFPSEETEAPVTQQNSLKRNGRGCTQLGVDKRVRATGNRPPNPRDSLTLGKLNPARGQHLPKASLRLASALVQPGGVGGREGEVQDDRPPLLLGTARKKTPRMAPALGRLGKPRIPHLYWPGLTVMSREGSLQGTWQGTWPTLGQPQIGPGSELEPQV